MGRNLILAALLTAVCAACASAPPVQEMSDARQAIRAAESALGPGYAVPLRSARALLERAQLQLEAGAYAEAREYAIEARKEALRARDLADNPQLRP